MVCLPRRKAYVFLVFHMKLFFSRAKYVSPQNMRNSENIGISYFTRNSAITNAYEPISCHLSPLIPPENIRKPLVF